MVDGTCTIGEERDGIARAQRWDPVNLLVAGAQRFAAGRQDRNAWAVPSNASATIAACTTTCSQLSRISSNVLFLRCSSSVSSSGQVGTSCTRNAEAIAAGINEGSLIGASPTNHAALASPSAVATCNAVWVLPTPPLPVSVSRRCSRTSVAISSSSRSRPTKLANESGRLR